MQLELKHQPFLYVKRTFPLGRHQRQLKIIILKVKISHSLKKWHYSLSFYTFFPRLKKQNKKSLTL